MPTDINGFVNSFISDLARPSKFEVTIFPPQIFSSFYLQQQSGGGFALRCENANLPGRTFGTTEQKFGSNPSQKFPMHSSYNDMDLTFVVSGDMSERNFFDIWMEYINPTTSFDFSYKKDSTKNNSQGYSATILVTQYDTYNNPVYTVQLYNAYPISVNQMDLDWSTDTYHKLTVVFAYDYWQNVQAIKREQTIPQPSNGQAPLSIQSLGVGGTGQLAVAQTNASVLNAIVNRNTNTNTTNAVQVYQNAQNQ